MASFHLTVYSLSAMELLYFKIECLNEVWLRYKLLSPPVARKLGESLHKNKFSNQGSSPPQIQISSMWRDRMSGRARECIRQTAILVN